MRLSLSTAQLSRHSKLSMTDRQKKLIARYRSTTDWVLNLKAISFLRKGYNQFLESQQVSISRNIEGMPQLALLGLVCGLLSAGVIILFRLFMESMADLFIPNGDLEGFEQLSPTMRLFLCVAGGLIVGIILQLLKPKTRNVGVLHVLERLDYHQGYLSLKNAIVQFFTAGISLATGHSVGREGPSVHLGAAAGSLLGQRLHIPNNGIRILVGSGVAAAISAAFNTPLAGVIFAMEVVIMEYTVIGFTPVIIAAVSATTLTRLTLGDANALIIPPFDANMIQELPMVAFMGGLIGCISAAFIHATMITSSLFAKQAIWVRTMLAGVITGLIAMQLPQIMGTGYDTVDQLLIGQLSLGFVLLLVVAKTFATASAIGLGIPAGLIGPTLFIGAGSGSAIGLLASNYNPELANSSYYAMLGMAAMMAATLQAPLAALIYLLELTGDQSIILPGMTAVITASLITRVFFKKSSIYRHLMLSKGLDYRNSPLSIALRRIGVASVMERNIIAQPRHISVLQAQEILKLEPRWIMLSHEHDKRKNSLLPATDIARYLNELSHNSDLSEEEVLKHEFDLHSIPAKRLDTASITIVATLQEAHETMESEQCEVLYINGAHGEAKKRIYGVITRAHIESSYKI